LADEDAPPVVVQVDFRQKVKRVGREAFIRRTSKWSTYAMQGDLEQVAKARTHENGDELPEARLAIGTPVAGCLILVDAEGDFVLDMIGEADWGEIFRVLEHAAWSAVRNATVTINGARYSYQKGWIRAIRDEIDNRRRSRDYQEAEEAKRLAAKPWICEHCKDRFATKRGCEQHETLHCYSNPNRKPPVRRRAPRVLRSADVRP
jgi:ribosomal protein L37AE/L43A